MILGIVDSILYVIMMDVVIERYRIVDNFILFNKFSGLIFIWFIIIMIIDFFNIYVFICLKYFMSMYNNIIK